MPRKTKITDAIFARIDPKTAETINAITEKHQIEAAVLVRGVVRAACAFYEKHGWFSFPVIIQPEAFQARYVAEEQALYAEGKRHLDAQPKTKRSGENGPKQRG